LLNLVSNTDALDFGSIIQVFLANPVNAAMAKFGRIWWISAQVQCMSVTYS